MGSFHRNICLMQEFLKVPFFVLHFSYYKLMAFLMMLPVMLLSMLMILLSFLCVMRHLICGNNQNWHLNMNLIYKTLYLYISTLWPFLEYCCHVWTGAHSCYLELLDQLQKQICRTVDPSLATSLELLAHRENVAS